MKKISTKFMVVTLCCCIFVSLLISGFSLYLGTKYIKQEAFQKLNFMASSYGNEFSQSIKETESYVDALHSYILTSFDMDSFRRDPYYIEKYEKEIDRVLNEFGENNNDAFGMYVTFNPDYTNGKFIEIWYEDFKGTGILFRIDGDMISKYPEIFKEGWTYPCVNSFDRDEPGMKFLYDTMAAKKPLWFKPYQEIGLSNTTLSHVTVISYVEPVIIDGTTIGVVGMDYNFDTIQKTIAEMNIYKKGYAFLIDENSNIIVQPNGIKNPSPLKDIADIIKNTETRDSGVINDKRGAGDIIGYSRLSNGWVLVLVPTRDEIYQPVWQLSLLIALLTFSGILISLILANFLTKKVKKRFDRVTDQLRFIEDGDFNMEMPEELLNKNDDLGYVAKTISAMQTIIKDMMELSPERAEKEENLRETLKKLEELNAGLQNMVDDEVLKNRQKDAILLYQSRFVKMGEMVGNIAHQWRQPLNSLAIILSELKDSVEYNGLDLQHFDRVIEKSNQIIQSMSQTINDFRDFLKPSKQKTEFSVHKAVTFSLSLTEESIKSNSITVTISLVEDATVYGYESEFTQVILNILSNSKDALECVKDKKRIISVDIRVAEGYSIIGIFNNGPLIPQDAMQKMFTPYFSTKSEEQGTGLGLYMSMIIINEHMDGEIGFQNVDGGVVCWIKLPVAGDRADRPTGGTEQSDGE